jgi:hypothetical protein
MLSGEYSGTSDIPSDAVKKYNEYIASSSDFLSTGSHFLMVRFKTGSENFRVTKLCCRGMRLGTITSASFYLRKTITGSNLASGVTDLSAFSTSESWINCDMNPGVLLLSNTTYYALLRYPFGNIINNVKFRMSDPSAGTKNKVFQTVDNGLTYNTYSSGGANFFMMGLRVSGFRDESPFSIFEALDGVLENQQARVDITSLGDSTFDTSWVVKNYEYHTISRDTVGWSIEMEKY